MAETTSAAAEEPKTETKETKAVESEPGEAIALGESLSLPRHETIQEKGEYHLYIFATEDRNQFLLSSRPRPRSKKSKHSIVDPSQELLLFAILHSTMTVILAIPTPRLPSFPGPRPRVPQHTADESALCALLCALCGGSLLDSLVSELARPPKRLVTVKLFS